MINIEDYIIDYEVLSSFCINDLKENLVLPLCKNDLFISCISYLKETDVSELLNKPSKILNSSISRSKLLFYLQDLKIKKELFLLSENKLNVEDNSVNKFITLLFTFAHNKGASDIHFDVNDKIFQIRLRIDGILSHYFNFNKELFTSLSSVLKLYSSCDITQNRKPISGRFSQIINNKQIDFRLSTMPTIHGESIVLRILDKMVLTNNLQTLGFNKISYDLIMQSLKLTNGIILVTGPTGSGKTTTLYSMLNILKTLNKKIITIEDPVEYKMNGLVQVEVNEKIGLTYHEILKNILRQDPDIILIGEIRDELSLSIAMQASLTGHLVLATLHTNDTIDTINRLKDLKAQNYLISNTIKTIISQRLILKYCKLCKKKGCSSCNYTGYKNREVLSETLYINESISSMLLKNDDTSLIKKYLHGENFHSLEKDGMEKVKNNVTSIDEINRVLKQYL